MAEVPCFENARSDWATNLVAKTRNSLTHLKLGGEMSLGKAVLGARDELEGIHIEYFTDGIGLAIHKELQACLTDQDQISGPFKPVEQLLNLTSLHLIGTDLRKLTVASGPRLLNWERLESLALESCIGVEALLDPPQN